MKVLPILETNDDLRRLLERGYALSVDSGHLVIRDIPYLDASGKCNIGAIVTKLTFVDDVRIARPDDHQIFFAGAHPCTRSGSPIPNLAGGATTISIAAPDVRVERSFSNKPPEGFSNFFDKIESYVTIISGPAMEAHDANPRTFRFVDEDVAGSVFRHHDTLSSRAEIGDLSSLFKDEVVAVIGLGGTGSYVLDFLVKTPVKEIRGYDGDDFHVHNAFRAPGRLDPTELGQSKAAVHMSRHDGFRHGLRIERRYIDRESEEALQGVTFAFVCVDKGTARGSILDLLIRMKIPFIDVGMGLRRESGRLTGMVRTTYFPENEGEAERQRPLAPTADDPDDVYRTQIQLSELNALNAALAVLRYKQLKGFYGDEQHLNHFLFGVEDFRLLGESAA